MSENEKLNDLEQDVVEETAADDALNEDGEYDAPEMTADELADLLIKLGKEKQAEEERYIRLQADFDNYRKRTQREKEELVLQANSELFKLLLPVIDNIVRAGNMSVDAPSESVIAGIKMILKQLAAIMGASGIEPIDALGKEFDPRYHDAVMQEDAGEENSGKVIEELQKGYMMSGKLLRPSMVKVGK